MGKLGSHISGSEAKLVLPKSASDTHNNSHAFSGMHEITDCSANPGGGLAMKFIRLLIIIFASGLIGCAHNMTFSQFQEETPGLKPGHGRIYFYRLSASKYLKSADIYLNRDKVGSTRPWGFVYVDRPPGDYRVWGVPTKRRNTIHIDLIEGQTVYVRFDDRLGLNNYPYLVAQHVNPNVGMAEIRNCSLRGDV